MKYLNIKNYASEFQLIEPSEMFQRRWRWFGKFKREQFDTSCLFVLDRKPIRLWGDWYFIGWMR